jgi:hypothetical protein
MENFDFVAEKLRTILFQSEDGMLKGKKLYSMKILKQCSLLILLYTNSITGRVRVWMWVRVRHPHTLTLSTSTNYTISVCGANSYNILFFINGWKKPSFYFTTREKEREYRNRRKRKSKIRQTYAKRT